MSDAIDCPCGRWACGRGSPISCQPCEVLMDDGTWAPGRLQQETRTASGHAALIGLVDEPRFTAWFYRERGSGRPNEWRWPR